MSEEKSGLEEIIDANTEAYNKAKGNGAKGEWEIDLKGFKVKQYRQFYRIIATNNVDGLIALLGGRVTAWPFEGDPTDDDAWDELELGQFREALEMVGRAINNIFRPAED